MTMAGLTRKAAALCAALFLALGLAACEEQGVAERTGEAIDDTAAETSEMLEQEAQKVEESAEGSVEGAEGTQENAQ